jgi:hypothetical protein
LRITDAGTAAGVGDSCMRPRCRLSPSESVQQQQQIEPEEERLSNH